MIDGRFDDAERFAQEARLGGERAGEPLANQFFTIQASLRYRLEGRPKRSRRQSRPMAASVSRQSPPGESR